MLLPQIIGGLLQEKPKVPKFDKINLAEQQQVALDANKAILPQTKTIASDVNSFNQDQLLGMLRKAVPDYDNIMKKGGSLIQSWMRGEISDDVAGQVSRNAAERAVGGGYAGSGMARNLEARDLGLTSLQLTQQGLDSASRWMDAAAGRAVPGLFDASTMFISPGQQFAATQYNNTGMFQRDWMQNQLDAEYSTGTVVGRAMIKTDDQLMQIASSVAGSAAGAAMCWVAREVYGVDNPKWELFKAWMLSEAPTWFRNLYMKFGERFAKWISNKPIIKSAIRKWMDSKIAGRMLIEGKIYSY